MPVSLAALIVFEAVLTGALLESSEWQTQVRVVVEDMVFVGVFTVPRVPM